MPFIRLKVYLFVIFGFKILTATGQSAENIHMHFDKDIYLPGETIWFKAYLYSNNSPAAISTNFYVGMYDDAGNLLEEKKYPVMNASCNGDFTLSDTIKSTSIRIRAVTKANWLRDSSDVFEKKIIVRTNEKRINENVASEENRLQIQFFSESGNFVAGISNFLAFKASYSDGSAALITGIIKDELNNTVSDSFKTTKSGLGKMQFTPGKDHKYMAFWNDSSNKAYLTALPNVQNNGVVLHTELVEDTVHYMVNKNAEGGNLQTIHLLAQMGDEEVYKADLLIGDKIQLVNKFSVNSMPAGIIQFTLFDINWHPIAQSILYINPKAPPTPSNIATIEKNTLAKAKNIIEINLPDSGLTNLSASIADINFYDRNNNQTIKQNLLFKPLKQLNRMYSDELENGTAKSAALLLLTHDWKKLNWQNIINNKVAETKPVDEYLSLAFNYKEKRKKLGQKNVLNLIISDKISGKQFFNLSPENANTFKQEGLVFYDSARLYFGIKNEIETLEYLTAYLDNNLQFPKNIEPQKTVPWTTVEDKIYTPDFIDTVLYNRPAKFNEEQTLKAVEVKSKYVNPITARLLELDNKYTTGMFSGLTRGYQFNLLDDKTARAQSDVLNYIVYRVSSLKICSGSFGERYLIYTRSSNDCSPQAKLITFVDEVELPEQEGLANIPVSQIAYIKYIPGIVIGSSFTSANGALYIYRKKGDEVDPSTTTMKFVTIKGYDLPKYFTNPDYSEKSSFLHQDFRTTLYWNPYLAADKDSGKIRIEYYNNDLSKKLLLTIEGIDADGRLIHIEKVIEN